MNIILSTCLSLLFFIVSSHAFAEMDHVTKSDVDFIHYKAQLEPNFKTQSVSGKVAIEFTPQVEKVRQLTFSAKYKNIYSVKLAGINIPYVIEGDVLKVTFQQALLADKRYVLTVEYRSIPKRGMKFFDDHLFSVYHTKNWLVSHDVIADKASFELFLTHDKLLTSVGNGKLIAKKAQSNGKVISHWRQESDIPVYTFGFALGEFRHVTQTYKNSVVSYLFRQQVKSGLTSQKVDNIFKDVPDMIEFFERKSGFSLPNNSYRYVVVEGYMAQEAAGFSLVGEQYAHTVLDDKDENWFIAHELAHEWWGNSITCANFSHFWLNEGLVQFLVAAYKQQRFGETAYKKELKLAIARVDRAVAKGKIAPVAFRHQIEEKHINRTMAYSKGTLIFYMLRNKLGEKVFWRALKQYSINNRQRSVTTDDLRSAFEKASEEDLSTFFNRWVYGEEVPKLTL